MAIIKSKLWFKKKRSKTPKEKAWDAMSRYVRLRDAIDFCEERGIDLSQFNRPEDIIGQCCTCDKVLPWIRMQAGHWKPRGLGGGSGAYFDERNVNLQCCTCNGFEGGKQKEHEEYIVQKHGEKVRDEIELKHRMGIDMRDMAMIAMEKMYKEKYQQLLRDNGLRE